MLPKDWLDQIKEHYPKRKGSYGWYELERHIKARLAQFTWDQIIEGTKRYRAFAVSDEIYGTCFVMQPTRFYGRGCYFMEEWETEPELTTLDDEARAVGIERQPGEDDDGLKRRIGIAQTQKMYQR